MMLSKRPPAPVGGRAAWGRKNWLFVGNVEAGERAAMLMTMVSSAKRHHLDVWMYLKNVLDSWLPS